MAQGYDVEPGKEPCFELTTAFAVFEHLPEPMDEFENMLSFSRNVLFSTALFPEDAPKPGQWWYYALDGGQHISFYTIRALEIVAQRLGLHLTTDGRQLHLLTEKPMPRFLTRWMLQNRKAGWLNRLYRRAALLPGDYERVKGRKLA